ncbi:MAG: U32 family peptidase [Candidatus Syntropharchaeia archaeon]
MKLCLPHPGHFEALKSILDGVERVYEVYMGGSPEYIGTGRVTLAPPPDIEEIREQVEYAHERGVKIDTVLNSSCLGGLHLSPGGYSLYHRYLEMLNDVGVDSVTLADPYFIEMASNEFDFEVVVSCISYVDSPEKAVFFEELGADTITLEPSINRCFDILEGIRESTSCELRILVNEGCLYKCPFRLAHVNLTSHRNGPNPPKILYQYYQNRCNSMRVNNPELILKANWVRPEDVEEYERIGIDSFKVSGRMQSVNWIIEVSNAYANRSYKGNLVNLLDYGKNFSHLFYIPNEELDGVIEQWKKCDKVCVRCGFCKKLASRVVRVYSGKGTIEEQIERWKGNEVIREVSHI